MQDAMRKQNTCNVIEYFKGVDNEFYLLKGLLIASHNMNEKGKAHFDNAIDTLLIAGRMDALNKADIKKAKV